jgi:hypothetical protein
MIASSVRPDVSFFLAACISANAPPIEQVGIVTARAAFSRMRKAEDFPVGPLAVMQDLRVPAPAAAADEAL